MTQNKLIAIVVGVVLLLISGYNLAGKNDAGYYQFRQNIFTGEMSMRVEPGIYYNGFNQVKTYQIETSYTFGDDENEDNVGKAIRVRFKDGGLAKISGDFRFRLPSDPLLFFKIHEIYGSNHALMDELYIQAVKGSIFNTSQLMTSEESYNAKSQFPQFARDQLDYGVYKTEAFTITVVDSARGTTDIKKDVRIRTDANGLKIRNEPVLKTYGIITAQATIREPVYDAVILGLISQKRAFEVDVIVARADADKARQKKLTVIENGKKDVTEAEYEAIQSLTKVVEEAKKDKVVALKLANQKLNVAEQGFQAEQANADGLISEATGEADKRRKVMLADGALVVKAKAYKQIMGYYNLAFKNMSWTAKVSTSSNAVKSGELPPAIQFLNQVAINVAKDINLKMSL